VIDEDHLAEAFRYVPLNPVRAKLVKKSGRALLRKKPGRKPKQD
jgi:hypothetical protein